MTVTNPLAAPPPPAMPLPRRSHADEPPPDLHVAAMVLASRITGLDIDGKPVTYDETPGGALWSTVRALEAFGRASAASVPPAQDPQVLYLRDMHRGALDEIEDLRRRLAAFERLPSAEIQAWRELPEDARAALIAGAVEMESVTRACADGEADRREGYLMDAQAYRALHQLLRGLEPP